MSNPNYNVGGVDQTPNDPKDLLNSLTGSHQIVMCDAILFSENGAGTYTGTINLPPGSLILDIGVVGVALWTAATSASMIIGDDADPDGFFAATDLKATALLAGETNNIEHPGGLAGAYITAEQRLIYQTTARNIIGVITSVGAGTAGRSLMYVEYCIPSVATVTQ